MGAADQLQRSLADSYSRGSPQSLLPAGRQAACGAKAPQVLLAEDDDQMRAVLALHLRKSGYHVTECRDGAELVSHLDGYLEHENLRDDAEQFDLIISDVRMPGVFGLSVVEGAPQRAEFPPIILITAFGDDETHATAKRCGVLAVLDKPFEAKDLLTFVRAVVPSNPSG